MALKVIFILAAILIGCAHARPGGPAAYSISAASADHASVGNTQEHTVKGHYGQSSQSDYSSAVQTANSQSHVQRSSISNDAGVAPHVGEGHIIAAAAPVAHTYAVPAGAAYATHAYAQPVASYGNAYGHGYGHGYAAAAPALGHGYAYASPIAAYHPAPSYSLQAIQAPAYAGHYAAAAAPAYVGHYASGASYGHGGGYVSLPAAASYKYASAAPAYGYLGHAGIAHGYPLAAPALAPLAVKAVAAPALVHTSVAGHGVHYGY